MIMIGCVNNLLQSTTIFEIPIFESLTSKSQVDQFEDGELISIKGYGGALFTYKLGDKTRYIPPHLVEEYKLKLGDEIKICLRYDEKRQRDLIKKIIKI